MRCILVLIPMLLVSALAKAQQAGLEDAMYADGKYLVAFTVVLVMLAVILGYLFFLDRKMRKMENEENNRL